MVYSVDASRLAASAGGEMAHSPTPKRRHATRPVEVRAGRPPRNREGEVEERILNAARAVFLERGLGGASIDEIARVARAAKATIYGRYATKEALFAAVGMQSAARNATEAANFKPASGTLQEQLAGLGMSILERLLSKESMDFMRLAVGEARRVPELGAFGKTIRERAASAVGQALAELARTETLADIPAFSAERLSRTTQLFLDIAVARFLLRGLLGEDLARLRKEAKEGMMENVALFLAACGCPAQH